MGVLGMVVCCRDRSGSLFFSPSLQVVFPKTLNFAGMKSLRRIILVLSISIGACFSVQEVAAQCPMCKMSAESNLKSGGTTGKGLNTGILYMLALPYTLLGTFGYIWWKNNRRKEEDEVDVLP